MEGKFSLMLIVSILILFPFNVSSSAEKNFTLNYEREYPGAFKGNIKANGLEANHKYVLTINGRKEHKSNKTLIEKCELWEPTGEGFCDFAEVRTDRNGSLDFDFEEKLPKGEYKIKFLVKDPSNDYLVEWSKNVVKFEVKDSLK
ncbi:hypothetical protein [Desulfobacter postgatei]|jgi:hypothetical protein|uniref:hypothetical protein n=1 Tax=Desulfobacter TaxID=2289 RepID=UPI002A3719F8|nr:hypothetical protein [Desulfobacter postgatei]MDX9964786.1 hypothetical protein [Desulfobacter postgatei]